MSNNLNSTSTDVPVTLDMPANALERFAYKMEHEYHVDVPLYNDKWPNALRWRGSVLRRIWWIVLAFAGWAAIWTVVHRVIPLNIGIPTFVIQVLGMVLSLLLVFRTNTAYDRFWEGRRIWGNTVLGVRNLTRLIWVGVKEDSPRDAIEKRSAINLLVAFAVATKHYLRAEYGSDYADMRDYMCHIPKYNIPTAVEPSKTATTSLLKEYEAGEKERPSNLPLELSIYLTSYVHTQMVSKNIDAGQFTALTNSINSLVDCLTGFERILRTPIPLAYSIHLSQSVLIYCLALPFQLVSTLGWVTIPVVAATAFTMFGIQSIGEEIENPFGYDSNDLPLEDFCKVIKSEVDIITAVPPPNPEDWIFSELNPVQRHSQEMVGLAPASTMLSGRSSLSSMASSKRVVQPDSAPEVRVHIG